jgi:hypothetical protein
LCLFLPAEQAGGQRAYLAQRTDLVIELVQGDIMVFGSRSCSAMT